MKSSQKWSCYLLFQLLIITWAACEPPTPYCYRNVTETSYKLVTKTRIKTVNSKNIFRKVFNKKDTQIEIYEDHEPVYKVKVERFCCEGYKLSELDLCEPQCIENGCPNNSKCVEPEVCECLKGYFSKRSAVDGKHYCEPICEKPCPENSACVAPNECACLKGYQVTEDFKCKAHCASGCPNGGECKKPNICSCVDGYKSEWGSCVPLCYNGIWNKETKNCESYTYSEDLAFSTTWKPEFSDATESNPVPFELETDIETSNGDIDPNQVFYESTDSTDVYDSSSTQSPSLAVNNKCPDDFVYHNGQCNPLKFVTNEIDCWLKPCQDKNAICLENGTCACNEGFKWFKTHVVDHDSLNETIKAVCLSLAEYDAKLQHLKEDSSKTAVDESTSITSIFFIIVGVLVMTSALIFLLYKLLISQRGEMDVENKNLACAYDNRACSEAVKSII
ncbi:uncharacterized protein ACRADG_005211 [Cochliomyia hominivorax]